MIAFINKYIFGTAVPIMLVLAGMYYLVLLRGFHITKIKKVIKVLTVRQNKNGVSPFRAVTLALAGTLGVGNIVGVSAAIYLGGFGSIFWMWVSAFFAMLLKYAEIVLAVKHRRYDENNKPYGSAMIYIEDYFKSIGLRRLGCGIAVLFSLLCILNSISMGSMIQVNAITGAFESVWGISPIVIGVFLSVTVLFIISRGSEGISRFTEMLVPIMTLGYVVLSLAVIFLRLNKIDDAFISIFKDAFKVDSAVGGILGFFLSRALRFGTMRGLVSNEAGCGTAPTAHSTSNTKSPVEQGFWGIFEVFVDTILLCTMTAIVVIISFSEVKHFGNNFIMMTLGAYKNVLGDFAAYFLAVAVLFFAFATIICWAHYGMQSVMYLKKSKFFLRTYIVIYSLSVFLGAIISTNIIWEAADFAIGAMTVINVIIICLMSREVKKETEWYFENKEHSKYKTGSYRT